MRYYQRTGRNSAISFGWLETIVCAIGTLAGVAFVLTGAAMGLLFTLVVGAARLVNGCSQSLPAPPNCTS